MSCCWEGGWGSQPEDERESAWTESEGDLPFLPDTFDDEPEWVEPAPGDDPLYDLYKRDMNESEDDGA